MLDQKINFGRGPLRRPIADGQLVDGFELLQHILFGQSPLELLEQRLLRNEGADIQIAHGRQEPNIQQKQFEVRKHGIGNQGHGGLVAPVQLMDKAGIGKPFDGQLVFTGPGAFFQISVNELPVLTGQLRRQRLPDQPYPWNDFVGCMFGKIDSKPTVIKVLLYIEFF